MALTAGLSAALGFFVSVFRSRRYPPRVYRLRGRRRGTVRVWTDAAWEPDEAVPARVAYVVFFPSEGPPLQDQSPGANPTLLHDPSPTANETTPSLYRLSSLLFARWC